LHRKENNELIVKLLDFGLAFLTSESQESDSKEKLTQTGATLGTLNYFAPEQAIGQRDKIGPPTDIWAVGIIVFELLTGQCYFPGSDHTVAVKIARGQLTPPSERVQTLSKDFDKWFYKSCDLDPSKRWASLPEQAAALGEALGISAAAMESAPAPASLSDWVAARLKNNQGDQAGAPVDPLAVTDASGPTGKAVQVIAKTGVLAKPPPKRTSLVSRVLDGQSWRRSTVIIGICGLIALLVFVLAFLFRRDGGIVPRPDSQVQPRDAAKQPPNVSAKTATEPGVPSPATPTAAETSDADADADKLFHHGKKKHKPQRGGKHTPAAKSTSPGEFDPAAP
jgi:hypothetical protein